MPEAPFLVMAKPAGPTCNLACDYCYYLAKRDLFPPGERFRMSEEVLEAYVRSYIGAHPGPVVQFVWHGGEPTLAGIGFYRRAVELQKRHLPEGWQCVNNLQTNGTLLDDDWCAFLAEEHFAVGLSIDGPEGLHDAFRHDRHRRGSHAKAMRGLRRLRAHGIEPDVLCTVNAANAGAPLDVYRFFLDEGVRWLQFLPVVERTGGTSVSSRSVGAQDFGDFLCEVFDEWVRYDVERIAVQTFLEALLVLTGKPADLCVMAETCGLALALEHDGSIYACDHFVDLPHRLGNLLDPAPEQHAALAAAVGSAAQVTFGRAKKDLLPRWCKDCPVLSLCNGGCPKDRFLTTADGEPGLNYLCAGYRAFFTHALPTLTQMARLALAGRPVGTIMRRLAEEERDVRRRYASAGRNDPCPCGSARKYKLCCLPKARRGEGGLR